jgi:dolichol-phosphate mannosyltransferase
MRALVVLPTFNEAHNLERVVEGVRALGHDVLVVDDASPDGTGRIADGLAAGDSHVQVLHRAAKLGLGSAYVQGFQWGLAHGHDLLVEMDADGSHLPEHLEAIVEATRRCGGMAIGSRYVSGGSIVGWRPPRYLLSWGANAYTRMVLGLEIRDCTSGYRGFTRRVLEDIGLDQVFSSGYSFQIEMVFRCVRLGYAVVEVPIRFEDRVAGISKVSRGEIGKALGGVLRMRFQAPPKTLRTRTAPRC